MPTWMETAVSQAQADGFTHMVTRRGFVDPDDLWSVLQWLAANFGERDREWTWVSVGTFGFRDPDKATMFSLTWC